MILDKINFVITPVSKLILGVKGPFKANNIFDFYSVFLVLHMFYEQRKKFT